MSRLTLTAALILMACCAAAQENEVAFDALYWLPDGSYGYIAFTNWTGLQKTAVYADYEDLFINSEFCHVIDSSPLPETVRESVEWICMARQVRMRLADEDEMEEISQVRTVINMSEGGKPKIRKEKPSREEMLVRSVRNDEGTLWVAAFYDTKGLVKEALADGWLSRSGEKFMGRPIYALSGKETSERRSGYAYATVTNELLMADEIEILKEMVESGMGQGSSFVYGEEFNDLAPFISDLGQNWQVSVTRSENREAIDLWAEFPELDERVEKLEEQLSEGQQYEITSYEANDTIVEKTICIFGSDDSAAQSAEEIRQRLLFERENFLEQESSMKITVTDGDGKVDRDRSERMNRQFKRSSMLSSQKAGKTEVMLEDNVVTTLFAWGERQLQTMRFLRSDEGSGDVQIMIQMQSRIEEHLKELPHRP